MKISQKLIFVFGVFILVLLSGIIINQIIANRAAETYKTLQLKIEPAIKVLNKYESTNRELNLLINNGINSENNRIEIINRINEILEVEIPHIKTQLYLLKEGLSVPDSRIILIEELIRQTDEVISLNKTVNSLLRENNKHSTKMNLAQDVVNNQILELHLSLDRRIGQLYLNYNRSFKIYHKELSTTLTSVSKIILIIGVFGILLAIVIAVQVTSSISKPLWKLKKALHKVEEGEWDEYVEIKGKNEIADLGNSFNNMNQALKKGFIEQQEYIDRIESMNKELQQFVYIASHDLQEPLRTMTSYVALLNKLYKDQLDDQALRFMKHIEDASLRMKALIKDLLDYSRLGKQKKFITVDCNQLLDQILLDLELIIRENKVSIQIEELPTLVGLEIELKQLFQNLISNAIKFQKKDVSPEIKIKIKNEPEQWVFSVQDNGIGIEKEHLDRVFIIFQRLHNRDDYEGTGIGLSVCKKIVDVHQGTMWIESEINQGSIFYFTISKKIKPNQE